MLDKCFFFLGFCDDKMVFYGWYKLILLECNVFKYRVVLFIKF